MRKDPVIKICGMRDPANLEMICDLRPDMVGFIFYPASARYVGDRPDPALFRIPGSEVVKVGVFVNASANSILRHCHDWGLDMVQLHGSESPAFGKTLAARIPLIRSFSMGGAVPDTSGASIPAGGPDGTNAWSGLARFFLLDTATKGYGGSGKKFDWRLLKEYAGRLPFLLSGGIGPDDANGIRKIGHPLLHGVDINSRFESSPGIKNTALVQKFIKEIRN